jgi:tetratricopeptide (TPR) repeat protein
MESPEYLYGSGQLLLEAGDIDQAEAFFDKALAADDTYIAAMTGMADVALARGDTDKAVYWAKRAVKKSATDADRRDAITALMKVYGSTRPDGWLNKMESLWEDVREVEEKPEAAALVMGNGFQEAGHYLKAVVCYRQVINWQGAHAADADQALETLFRRLRAEPGSPVGRSVARLETVSRGDLCALIIEELKLPEYLDKQTPKKYSAGFVTPQQFAEAGETAPLPTDVAGSTYEVNIVQVLNFAIRGLEPFPDGEFHPNTPVSRAAFALTMEDILARVKKEPLLTTAFVGSSSPFPDVAADHFAFNAMVVCTTRDFLAADLDGAFRPDEAVSGAESLIGIRKLKEEIKGKQVRY